MSARPLAWDALAILVGGAVVACGPQVTPTIEPLVVVQEPTSVLPAGPPPSITVFNNSATPICFLFVSPTSALTWGDDWLRGTQVEVGGSLGLPVAPDTYDIKAEDCDGRVLHSSRALAVQGPVTWTVIFGGGPPLQFTLLNNSASPICHLHISPSTADGWGNDWLEVDETLEPGSSLIFEVPGGTYDLQAQDCSQHPISEQMGVSLDNAFSWDVR